MTRNLFCLFLLTVIFFNTKVSAQPEMDTTFNSTGKLVLSGMLASVRDIAIQSDNKMVFVAACQTVFGPFNICVGRVNADGTLDTTFGGTIVQGFSLTRIPGGNADSTWRCTGIAIQHDGKIVTAGHASFGGIIGSFLARYNSDGSLDTSFGTNGIVQTFYISENFTNKVLIQPDGKIVVVGYTQENTAYQQLITRYNPNGTLDQAFGQSGFVPINIPGNFTYGSSVALQADGKILTGGSAWTMPGDPNPFRASTLIRLNPDGTLDTTFDEDGIKTVVTGTTPAFSQGFYSLAVQSDGRILALNNRLYRFDTNGSPDTSFDEDGSRDILTANSIANGVTVTPSGKITVVGERTYCNCSVSYLYRVARYLPDGSPDKNFSGDGYLEIDVGASTNDFANAVTYDLNGRIVIGGFSATGVVGSPYTNATWSFARLIASPTQNVGFSGRVMKPNGSPVLNAFITLQNGSEIIGVGRTNPFGYFHIKNILSNQTYTLSTTAKGLNFTDRSVLVDDEITNYLVVGEQLPILIQK